MSEGGRADGTRKAIYVYGCMHICTILVIYVEYHTAVHMS